MKKTGQIYVNRKQKNKKEVYEQAADYLKAGEVVGIFPEGTRTRTGKMLPAFLGVARLALQNKTDILPIALEGLFEIMPPKRVWPKFKKIVKVSVLDIIRYEDIKDFSEEKIVHEILMPKIAKEIGDEYKAV